MFALAFHGDHLGSFSNAIHSASSPGKLRALHESHNCSEMTWFRALKKRQEIFCTSIYLEILCSAGYLEVFLLPFGLVGFVSLNLRRKGLAISLGIAFNSLTDAVL